MKRRVAIGCGLAALVLGVVFVLLGWQRADQLASVLGGTAGLLGLVVAWLGWYSEPSPAHRIRVTDSGNIDRHGNGTAVTGVDGSGPMAGEVEVDGSGDIRGGDGDGISGVRWRP